MDRSRSSQQQIFTARQLVVALGALVCLAFVVIYSGRIVLEMRARGDLAKAKTAVEREAARQQELAAALAAVENPEVVAEYARDELNQAMAGDQQIVPLPPATPPPAAAVAPTPVATPAPANWQLWWELVAPAAP